MLTLTYGLVKKPQFVHALAKIASKPMKNPKAAYVIARLTKSLGTETETVQAAFIKLIKGYAKLDDKGEFVPAEKEGVAIPGTYQIPEENQETFHKAMEEFHAMTFECHGRKITLDELEGCDLSAIEMDILWPIIQGEEEEEEEEEDPQPCQQETSNCVPLRP